MKKKLVSVFLVLVLVITSTVFAFAENYGPPKEESVSSEIINCCQYNCEGAMVMLPDGSIVPKDDFDEKLNVGYVTFDENTRKHIINISGDVDDVLDYIIMMMATDELFYNTLDARSPWPWTDCTNILGHNWGDLSNMAWVRTTHRSRCPNAWSGNVNNDTFCVDYYIRFQVCLRTNCNAIRVFELRFVGVRCN